MSARPSSNHSLRPIPTNAAAGTSSDPAIVHHEHRDIKVQSDGKVIETTTVEGTQVLALPGGGKNQKKNQKDKGKAAVATDVDEEGEEVVGLTTTTTLAAPGESVETTTNTLVITHTHPIVAADPGSPPPIAPKVPMDLDDPNDGEEVVIRTVTETTTIKRVPTPPAPTIAPTSSIAPSAPQTVAVTKSASEPAPSVDPPTSTPLAPVTVVPPPPASIAAPTVISQPAPAVVTVTQPAPSRRAPSSRPPSIYAPSVRAPSISLPTRERTYDKEVITETVTETVTRHVPKPPTPKAQPATLVAAPPTVDPLAPTLPPLPAVAPSPPSPAGSHRSRRSHRSHRSHRHPEVIVNISVPSAPPPAAVPSIVPEVAITPPTAPVSSSAIVNPVPLSPATSIRSIKSSSGGMKLPKFLRSKPNVDSIAEEDLIKKITTTTTVVRKASPPPAAKHPVTQNQTMYVQNITPPPTPASPPAREQVITTTDYPVPGQIRTITRTVPVAASPRPTPVTIPAACPPVVSSPPHHENIVETTTVETITYPSKSGDSPPRTLGAEPSVRADATTITTTVPPAPATVGYPGTPYRGDIKPIPYFDYSAMIKRTPPRRNRSLEFASSEPFVQQTSESPPQQTVTTTTIHPDHHITTCTTAAPLPHPDQVATRHQAPSRSRTPPPAPTSILQRAKTLIGSPRNVPAPHTVASIQMDIDRDADGNEHVHARMHDYTRLPQRAGDQVSALDLGVGGTTPMAEHKAPLVAGEHVETKSERKARKRREKEEAHNRRADERQKEREAREPTYKRLGGVAPGPRSERYAAPGDMGKMERKIRDRYEKKFAPVPGGMPVMPGMMGMGMRGPMGPPMFPAPPPLMAQRPPFYGPPLMPSMPMMAGLMGGAMQGMPPGIGMGMGMPGMMGMMPGIGMGGPLGPGGMGLGVPVGPGGVPGMRAPLPMQGMQGMQGPGMGIGGCSMAGGPFMQGMRGMGAIPGRMSGHQNMATLAPNSAAFRI